MPYALFTWTLDVLAQLKSSLKSVLRQNNTEKCIYLKKRYVDIHHHLHLQHVVVKGALTACKYFCETALWPLSLSQELRIPPACLSRLHFLRQTVFLVSQMFAANLRPQNPSELHQSHLQSGWSAILKFFFTITPYDRTGK